MHSDDCSCCIWQVGIEVISATEMQWVQMMVETLRKKGFRYYVAREVYDNDYCDVELYASSEPISFDSANVWTVSNGIVYKMDSSPRYYSSSSYSGNSVVSSSFSGRVVAAGYEFVYSNAEFEGITLVPDLRQNGGIAHDESQTASGANLFVLLAFCLSCFAIKLFRA